MSLPNIISEINTIKSTYLPSIGGNLSGVINFLNTWGDNIGDLGGTVGSNNYRLRLTGGEYGWAESGGVIELFSRSNTGYVTIQAQDGTNSSTINIAPNGAFTHNGNNVITSAGGTINGNLTLGNASSSYGLQRPDNSGELGLRGGVGNDGGAYLYLHGKDMGGAESDGRFDMGAVNSSKTYMLTGKPDGTFTWGGKHIVRNTAASNGVNGYRKYSDGLIVQWGTYTNTSTSGTITFPVAFSNTNYSAVIAQQGNNSDTGGWGGGVALNPTKTTTTITYSVQEKCKITWIAIGY